MLKVERRERTRRHSPVTCTSPSAPLGYLNWLWSAPTDHTSIRRRFRWAAVIGACVALWVVGADWRTVVMVAGAAFMLARAIDEIEK